MKNNDGFTLVEMIVVIVIITIISGSLIVSGTFLTKQRARSALEELQTLYDGLYLESKYNKPNEDYKINLWLEDKNYHISVTGKNMNVVDEQILCNEKAVIKMEIMDSTAYTDGVLLENNIKFYITPVYNSKCVEVTSTLGADFTNSYIDDDITTYKDVVIKIRGYDKELHLYGNTGRSEIR